jgi:uncharacterized coiled-coil protein SlyX
MVSPVAGLYSDSAEGGSGLINLFTGGPLIGEPSAAPSVSTSSDLWSRPESIPIVNAPSSQSVEELAAEVAEKEQQLAMAKKMRQVHDKLTKGEELLVEEDEVRDELVRQGLWVEPSLGKHRSKKNVRRDKER